MGTPISKPIATGTRLLSFLLLGTLLSACDKPGPTEPRLTVPTPTPVPDNSKASNIAGTWTGTFHDHGVDDDHFCPGHELTRTVEVTQSGASVLFRSLVTGLCSGSGPLTFEGQLRNGNVSGNIVMQAGHGSSLPPCVLKGASAGSATNHEVRLTGRLKAECNWTEITITLTR
jgi:hypothetical protein